MSEKKGRKLKGSVLFTTLTVMFVMIILILTTIALAGAASQKAYSNWYDNQTNYTAQSLVDDLVTSLANGENAKLGSDIIEAIDDGVGKSVTVDVTEKDDSAIPGYGRIEKITFTNVGTNSSEEGANNFYLKENATTLRDKMIVKITAEISMNGGRERSTYTKYVIGSSEDTSSPSPSGPGGLNALSEFKSGAGSNDGPQTIGKTYGGITKPLAGYTISNTQGLGGDIYLRLADGKSLTQKGQADESKGQYTMIFGRNDPYNNSYSGIRVDGDIDVGDNALILVSKYCAPGYSMPETDCFNNIPYFYASKKLTMINNASEIKVKEGLLNIFCDSMELGGNNGINGKVNIICLGDGKDNSMKGGDHSDLIDWVAKTVSKDAEGNDVETPLNVKTGNVYCNGNLKIEGKPVTVKGDLYVKGKLDCQTKLTVNGAVYYGSSSGAADNVPVKTVDETVLSKLTDDFNDAITTNKAINGSSAKVEMFQTYENVKLNFNPEVKADGTHIQGERSTTNLSGVNEYKFTKDEGTYVSGNTAVLVGNSFVFGGTSNAFFKKDASIDTEQSMHNIDLLFIQPKDENDLINIDFTDAVTEIGQGRTIVIDDTKGAEIFFRKSGGTFKLENFKILSLSYYKLMYPTAYNNLITTVNGLAAPEGSAVRTISHDYSKIERDGSGAIPLQTYYDKTDPRVPNIRFYSAPGNKMKLAFMGSSIITGDFIMPDAIFESKATGDKFKVCYTSMSNPPLAENSFTVNKDELDIAVIGSLAFGEVDVTNLMGYLYVDESSALDPGPGDSGKDYAWADVDGYSNF